MFSITENQGSVNRVTYNADHDTYTVDGATYHRRGFVLQTDACIEEVFAANRQHRTPHPRALEHLRAVGITSHAALRRWFEDIRPRLQAPADPSGIVRCTRCGSELTAPESKARGMGPECARKAVA